MLAAIPDAVVVEDTGDEANITFAPEYLNEVVVILKLRRKRQYTPAQWEEAVARLAKIRPKPLSGVTFSRLNRPSSPSGGKNPA
jgi:hypothetical protein